MFTAHTHRGSLCVACACLLALLAVSPRAVAQDAPPSPDGHYRDVDVLRFSPDGALLATGSHAGRIKLWDVQTGKLRRTLRGHELAVSGLAFTEDGKTLVSAGWNGTVRTWSVATGEQQRMIEAHDDLVRSFAVAPDGQHVVTASNDSTVVLWNLQGGRRINGIDLGQLKPASVALGPDGRTLAIGTYKSTVQLWDIGAPGEAADWQLKAELQIDGRVGQVAFIEGGKQLLVGRGGAIEVWSVARAQRIGMLDARGAGSTFDRAADGRLATLGRGRVSVWAGTQADKPLANWKTPATGVAIDAAGKRVAVGLRGGAVMVRDATSGELLHALARGGVPAVATEPPASLERITGTHLLGGAQWGWWHVHAPTGALHWMGQAGLGFKVKATPRHQVGRDYLVMPTGIGDRPFDLTVDVKLDHMTGPGVFFAGLAIGMGNRPLPQMGNDDVAALVAIHFDGIYAGVHRGRTYALDSGYNNIASQSLTRLTGGGFNKATINWSNPIRSLLSTDRTLRLRIRREPGNVLHFVAWSPELDQTAAEPWWQGRWQMPDELADVPLEHLFIRRIPISSVHLGAQDAGYGEILRMAGRITDMRLRLNPPAIHGVTWDQAVLEPGSAVTIRYALAVPAAGVPRKPIVRIGGKPATVQRVDGRQVTVALPDLAPGKRYHVELASVANGPAAVAPFAVPVGRLLESATRVESLPDGGDVMTLEGAGFTGDTQVRFGDAPAEIVEVVGSGRIRVRIPSGKTGAAPITARTGEHAFAGQMAFGYAVRPNLWFTANELAQLRRRWQQPPAKPFREAIVRAGQQAMQVRVGGGHGREAALHALLWAYTVTGEDAYRDRLLEWIDHVAESRAFNEWDAWGVSAVAAAYDLTVAAMTAQQRTKTQTYLMAAMDFYAEAERTGGWSKNNISSTNPAVNQAAVALSILFEHVRDDSEAQLAAARADLLRYIDKSYAPDGGTNSALSRGTEGLGDYLLAGHLLARRGDDTLLEHSRLKQVPDLYRVVLASPDRMLAFGKTRGEYEGLAVASMLGSKFEDSLLLWIAEQLVARAGYRQMRQTGPALVFRTGEAAPDTAPALPTVAVLDRVQWAVMRSAPAIDADLVVGAKGTDGPMPYHQQHDVGSYSVFAHGREMVVDPGWGQTHADQHSLPIIDGQVAEVTGGFVTDAWERGDRRAIVVETTQAYGPADVQRVRRNLVMVGQTHLVILDDIVPAAGQPGRVVSHLQTTRATIDADGQMVRVQRPNVGMAVGWFGADVELSQQKRKRRYDESHWHTLQAAYTADPDRPLVTVLRFAEGDAPQQVGATVEYAKKQITVDLGEGQVLTFMPGEAGWGLLTGDDRPDVLATPAPKPDKPVARAARADQPPKLDGDLDDPLWQKATPLRQFVVGQSWTPDERARFATQVKFAWDDRHLYVAIRSHEPKLATMQTHMQGPAQRADRDDQIMLLIDPALERRASRFFGVTLLASGMQLGPYGKHGDWGKPVFDLHAGRINTADEKAWTLEVAIPWDSILHDPWQIAQPPEPRSGMEMGLNLSRVRTQDPPEDSIWTPSYPWPNAALWQWGKLVLE